MTTALALLEQSGLLAHGGGDATARQGVRHRVPAIRRKADAEALGQLAPETTPLEIGAGRLALGGHQRLAVELLCNAGGLQDPLGNSRLPAAGLGNLDPALGCQHAHCLGKGEVFVAHQERDRVAALTASEAVEDPALRVHRERGSLLLVEGTQALEASPGLLEGDVAADQIDHINAIPNRLDCLFRDPTHWPAAPRRQTS